MLTRMSFLESLQNPTLFTFHFVTFSLKARTEANYRAFLKSLHSTTYPALKLDCRMASCMLIPMYYTLSHFVTLSLSYRMVSLFCACAIAYCEGKPWSCVSRGFILHKWTPTFAFCGGFCAKANMRKIPNTRPPALKNTRAEPLQHSIFIYSYSIIFILYII